MRYRREHEIVCTVRTRAAVLAAVAMIALWLGPSAFPQGQGTGSIDGVVTDASGAVIPGASVKVRNVGTNTARELVTDPAGRYRADLLQPGDYEVTASLSGFTDARVSVRLVVGSLAHADLRLAVAGSQQLVEVTGEAASIDTERTDVATTVGETSVENLPINGRRWENFVLLTPGVTNDGDFGLISYRGVSGLYNNNSIDGADNNNAFFSEARGRTRVSYTISQSSVREFQVGLANFAAEFGRAAGGTVNAVTKSGTNQFHGEGFYFIRDAALLAQNPRTGALGQPKPDERRQQFGLSLGGPIRTDRLFFFANYDQQKRNFPGTVLPNVAFRSASCTAPGCAATISYLDTLTGVFPRNGDNYIALGKLDWVIDPRHTLTGSYNFHKWDSPNGIQTQAVITVSPTANGTDGVRTDMLNTKLTSLLGVKTVNEFRFQWGRDFEFQTPNAPGPSVFFTNGISYGMPNFLPRDAFPDERRFQYADNLSLIRGGHSLKLGFDINHVRELQINLFNGGGVYSFSSLNALAQDCPAQATGCVPVTTAPVGKHYNNFQQAFDLQGEKGRVFFTTTDWNFYFHDNYRLGRNFTLVFGLRYEHTQLPTPAKSNPEFPLTQSFNGDTNNLGPRFGFSWDVAGDHRTVVRGGYGMYYGRTSNSAVANGLVNNGVVLASYFMTPSTAASPVFPQVLSAPPAAGAGLPNINMFAADYVRPLIHSGDLVVEREIARGFTISGSYVFSRGLRLPLFRDINLPAPTGTVTYLLPDGAAAGAFPFYFSGTKPYTTANQVILTESTVTSSYNGFVLAASKRLSGGIQFSSHLTIAKALDTGQTSTTFFGSNQPYDTNNLSLDKGLSIFDVRKRWVTHFVLQPSVDRFTSSRAARGILNDWQFSGILTLSDGKPITGSISGGVAASVGASNSSTTNGSGGSSRVPFLARGSYTGTGLASFDLRLTRRFRVTERLRLELLAEAFNLFNRVNYVSHQGVQYRVVSSARSGSSVTVQLGEPTGSAFLSPINVGNTLFGPREIQLGLKLRW